MLKSILAQLDHHLLCFDELCVLFLSPWLSQGFQKKKKAKRQSKSTVETLGVRQDNLLGWSLWPLVWHFMERQPVVMGLPGTHISCMAFTLLLSLGSLIIYPWYNLSHDLCHKQKRKETKGQSDSEGVEGNAKKKKLHGYIPPLPILTHFPVKNFYSLCCSFTCVENMAVCICFHGWTCSTCVNIHGPTESNGHYEASSQWDQNSQVDY